MYIFRTKIIIIIIITGDSGEKKKHTHRISTKKRNSRQYLYVTKYNRQTNKQPSKQQKQIEKKKMFEINLA